MTSRSASTNSIVVFHPQAVARKYGHGAVLRLEALLHELVAAQERSGVSSELVSIPAGDATSGDGEAQAFKQVLDATCGPPCQGRSYLLVGGGDLIPLFTLADPTNTDGHIFSDRPYGASGSGLEAVIAGQLSPVGRLPGEPGSNDPDALFFQIESMLRAHALPSPGGGVFALAADCWRESTQQILEALGTKAKLIKLSEPVRLGDFDTDWLKDRPFVHFNLHGRPHDAYWRGTGRPSWKRRRAVQPTDFEHAPVDGAVVFAQCCYGARTRDRTRETSIALTLLSRGVRGFVGCLETSYGVDGERLKDLEESDIVAYHFWRLLHAGERIGQALFNAERLFAKEALASPAGLDADDRKTLLTFVLFGDPTLRGAPADRTGEPGRG